MKALQILKYPFIFLAGSFLGALFIYLNLYISKEVPKESRIKLSEVIAHSNTVVNMDSCEGDRLITVAEVLGNIIETNLHNKVNRTSLACSDEYCWVSVGNCNPWKSSECGSRILRFEVDSKNRILGSSFKCIDIP